MDEIKDLKLKVAVCLSREAKAQRAIMEIFEKITKLRELNDKHWREHRSQIATLDMQLYKIIESLEKDQYPHQDLFKDDKLSKDE